MKRLLIAVACGLAAVILPACGDREPVPTHTVIVRAAGAGYALDGMPVSKDQLKTELADIAQRHRRSGGGTVRAYVRIRNESGADYDRVLEVVDLCNGLGLDKVELAGQ